VAKLKAQKRRRRSGLKRLAIVLLVVVALVAAALGIVTLRIRAILLSVLRKQLPHCEVSVGRVTLNPFSNLSVYDLRIEDRSHPEAHSTIEIERLTANFSLAALLKFDIDLDVPGPEIVLRNIGGDPPPFSDLYAEKRKPASDRFLIRRLTVRDCTVAIDDPDLQISTKLDLELRNPGRRSSGEPTRLKVLLGDFIFEGGGRRTVALSNSLDVSLYGRPADKAIDVRGAIAVGGIGGTIDGSIGGGDTRVEATFDEHRAEALLGLWRRDGDYKIPFLHDFERLSGTVNRVALVMSLDSASGGGLRLDGEIEAAGLNGKSSSMGLEAEGVAVTTPFRLAAANAGGPMEFSVGDPRRMISPGRIAAKKVTWKKYAVTGAQGNIWMEENDWNLDGLRGTLYDGQGRGRIRALSDGRLQFELNFDDVNVEPVFATIGREGDKVTGLAEGRLALAIGAAGDVQAFDAHLRTKAPGGTIKFKEKETSFEAIPGGEQILQGIQQQLPSREYQHFLDKFKNYAYESIAIDAGISGQKYAVDVKIRDRDTRNPLPVDLKIYYERVRIYHE